MWVSKHIFSWWLLDSVLFPHPDCTPHWSKNKKFRQICERLEIILEKKKNRLVLTLRLSSKLRKPRWARGGKESSGGSWPSTFLQRSDRTPTALRPPGTNQLLKRDLPPGAWPQRTMLYALHLSHSGHSMCRWEHISSKHPGDEHMHTHALCSNWLSGERGIFYLTAKVSSYFTN